MNATTTLHSIVKEFQHLTGRDDNDYYRLLRLASRALVDLRKFHLPKVVVTKEYNLKNLTNGVLHYPDNCIAVVDIYYDRGNTLFPVTKRNDIVYHQNESGSVSDVDEIYDYGYWGKENGYYYPTANLLGYGVSGGKNEYYLYDDKENRRIIFDRTIDEKIWVRFVSTGIDNSTAENTIIPIEYQELIEAYILWQEALKHRNTNRNLVRLYKQNYNQESRRLKAFQAPSIEEWKDVIYSTFKQTPKR
jgi:hypothetical protein